MSDIPTPRTDYERELAVANERIRKLEEDAEANAWTVSPAMAQAKIDELNERIRRLESAGDAVAVWVSPEYETDPANAALKEWNQAKEAKP